jgi:hypothetical protein
MCKAVAKSNGVLVIHGFHEGKNENNETQGNRLYEIYQLLRW